MPEQPFEAATPRWLAASVVVPSHRGAHRLPDLLEAFAAQDVQEPWELVIALDGVLDESPQIIEAFSERVPLRVMATQKPRGVVATLNDAFNQAHGQVLIRCDDDLTPRPDYVRRHLAHHAGRTDVGVVGPTRDVFPETRYAKVYGIPANERLLAAAYEREPDMRWISWAANNSVHRDSWAKVGGFDPRFVYGQDSELGLRLKEIAGVEIVIDPELEIEHRGPSTSAANRVPRAFVSGASARLFDVVHPGRKPALVATAGGPKAQVWSRAVSRVADRVTDKDGYERLGRFVDRVISRLPARAAGKVVAFAVEAAGQAGRRHGNLDLSSYKGTKEAELAAELRPSKS